MVRHLHMDLLGTPGHGMTVKETVDGDLSFAVTGMHGQHRTRMVNICFDITKPCLREGLDVCWDHGPFSFGPQGGDLSHPIDAARLLGPIITQSGAFECAIQLTLNSHIHADHPIEVSLSHALVPIGLDLLEKGSLCVFIGRVRDLAWQRSASLWPAAQARTG